MMQGQTKIDVCINCTPVFNNGVQDMYYRHPACHDTCKRYNEQKAELIKATRSHLTENDLYMLDRHCRKMGRR